MQARTEALARVRKEIEEQLVPYEKEAKRLRDLGLSPTPQYHEIDGLRRGLEMAWYIVLREQRGDND